MASKFFCDGCDKELRDYDRATNSHRVLVEIAVVSKVSGTFDLCASCAHKMVNHADPTKWPRVAKAA